MAQKETDRTAAMSPEDVVRVVKANVGKMIKVYPLPHPHGSMTPGIVSVVAVDEEGFTCYDLSDPDLIDPSVMNYATFSEILSVEPVENRDKGPLTP